MCKKVASNVFSRRICSQNGCPSSSALAKPTSSKHPSGVRTGRRLAQAAGRLSCCNKTRKSRYTVEIEETSLRLESGSPKGEYSRCPLP